MSVPPKTDQDVPPPHRRTLPHFPVNEQGMRELEIWLNDRFGGRGFIRYVFKNIGRWLYVRTTGSSALTDGYGTKFDDAHGFLVTAADGPSTTTNFGKPDILLSASGGTGSVIFKTDQGAQTSEIGLFGDVWQGYLDGGDEIVYLQGGDFLRYSGGGDVAFYTTDGALPNSGSFLVYTNGTSDDSAATLGNVEFHVDNSVGVPGNIIFVTDGTSPFSTPPNGSMIFQMAASAALVGTNSLGRVVYQLDEGGGGVFNIKTAGNTLVVNDSNGNPLVTYTG